MVTSYEIVLADTKAFQQLRWKYVVVDEGHRLKNYNSKLLRELRLISHREANRLLLTGVCGGGAWSVQGLWVGSEVEVCVCLCADHSMQKRRGLAAMMQIP